MFSVSGAVLHTLEPATVSCDLTPTRLAALQVPGPLSIFENDRQREDLERAMVFAAQLQAEADKAEAIKRKKERRNRKKDGINRNRGSGKGKMMTRGQSMKDA